MCELSSGARPLFAPKGPSINFRGTLSPRTRTRAAHMMTSLHLAGSKKEEEALGQHSGFRLVTPCRRDPVACKIQAVRLLVNNVPQLLGNRMS